VGSGAAADLKQASPFDSLHSDRLTHPSFHPRRVHIVAVAFDRIKELPSSKLESSRDVSAARILGPLLSGTTLPLVTGFNVGACAVDIGVRGQRARAALTLCCDGIHSDAFDLDWDCLNSR